MTSTHSPTRSARDSEASGSVSWLGQKGNTARLPRGRGTRRRVPHLLVGALLVVVCVGGALWWTSATQDRVPVLAIARPVSVGHLLERADLRRVEVSAEAGVAMVPVEQAVSVLGKPAATSLTPGALVTPASVGPAGVPSAGQAIVAVGLKPGQAPPELAAGTLVRVVLTAATPGAASVASQASGEPTWLGTVVGITAAGTDQTTVVSLQLPSTTAPALAQVSAGQVALVMLPGGER